MKTEHSFETIMRSLGTAPCAEEQGGQKAETV